MNYRSKWYRVLRTIFNRPYVDLGVSKYPKSWHPQADYSPVNLNKRDFPELDSSPEAAEKRTREARSALLVPLAAIIGVIVIFAAAIFIKTH